MMGWIIAGIILPSCIAAAWLIARKPLRQLIENLGLDSARHLFHRRREWLEADFLTALAKTNPIERLRWENAQWNDKVHWGRDHQTRRLLALVEIHFDLDPFTGSNNPLANHATAFFEYRKGRWFADGRRLDATRPEEAFLHGNPRGIGKAQIVRPLDP